MTGTGRVRRSFLYLLAPLVIGAIAFPAARSDAAEAASPTPAQVADGLKAVQHHADEAAEYAGTDKAQAEKHWDEAHETWEGFEDAIRGNDKDAYIAFEDAIDGLKAAAKAGDAKKAKEAADGIAKASKAYLAKFPGDAPAVNPAPAPMPDPAPAAKPAPAPVPDTPAPAPKPAPVPDAPASAAGRTAAAAPAATPAAAPAPAVKAAAAAPAAKAAAAAPAAEPAPSATLARTGTGSSALAALAGAAFGLGGLAMIGGARRRFAAKA